MTRRMATLALVLTLFGCGERSRPSSGGRSKAPATGSTADTSAATQDPLNPDEQLSGPAFRGDRQALANQRDAENRAAPLLVNPERTVEIPQYQMPERLRERLKKVQPELVVTSSTAFKLVNQHLKISSKESVMTFTGVLKIPGKQDEPIEMSCEFDKSKAPWSCPDMFPVNDRIAQERRLQATVECTDVYKCDRVGLELFVVINGKTRSQLFQSEKFYARRATSGDAEEYDQAENSSPAPEPAPAPPKPAIEPKPETPKILEKPTPDPGAPAKKYQDRLPQEPEGAGSVRKPPTTPTLTPTPAPGPSVVYQPPSEDPARETPPANQTAVQKSPPEIYQPDSEEEEEPSEEEFGELMDDANAAVEFQAPMAVPPPAQGKFSIPGIEKLRPKLGNGVPQQAFGKHTSGHLERAASLPASGAGFVCRRRDDRNFGTNLMMEMLKGASGKMDKLHPGKSPIVIANISKKTGGRLGQHSSHQNGLDADVAFPSTKGTRENMWAPCPSGYVVRTVRYKGGRTAQKSGKGCQIGSHISSEFDSARFWQFAKHFTCAEGKPVIAMFLDEQIKKHMCKFARDNNEDLSPGSCAFRTLQAMKHERNHHDHVHIRLKCPGNSGCLGRDAAVTLVNSTGC